MPNKINSSDVSTYIAEEESFKTLPTTPDWYEIEANSFSEFGPSISTVARNPISSDRQNRKSVVVDVEAQGGFNVDFMYYNLARILQGYMFANAREKASTKPLNGTSVAISNIDGTNDDYEAASGLDAFSVGDLVFVSGFSNSANNGLKRVTTVSATSLTVNESLTDDASPSTDGKIEVTGYQAASGDLNVAVSGTDVSITSTSLDFTTLSLVVGETIYVGGSATSEKFDNNTGYAFIKAISANKLTLRETTWTPQAETGTGKTIRLFFGTVVKNENSLSNIVRRTYDVERQLGNDGNGIQSEHLIGAVPSELVINMENADKLTLDLSFLAADHETRDGTTGLKNGNRINMSKDNNAYNSSSHIYRVKVYKHSDTTFNPASLFGFLTNFSLTIDNNIGYNKALGTLGAFEMSTGKFDVNGSFTAYFVDVDVVSSIRNNDDVGMNAILASNNQAIIMDIPLLGLNGGNIDVEEDESVMIPVENSAAEGANGYTLLFSFIPYVPDSAMAS